MNIADIILHQTCESCVTNENSFLYDLFKDFILPIGLALLASYMVFWIFVKETNRDKQKEKSVEFQQQKDNLQFFSNIVNSVIKTSEQQNSYILEFVDLYVTDQVTFHLLTFIPLNDMRRVTEDLDLEKYLLAYVNFFAEDRRASINEFNEIIITIDFLHAILKAMLLQLQKAQDFDAERKANLQSQYEAAHSLTAKLLLKFRESDEEIFDEMVRLGDDLQSAYPGNNYDLDYYYSKFFVPFNDFAVSYIQSSKQVDLDVNELAMTTRNGKQYYLQIKSENESLAEDLKGQHASIKKAIEELKSHTARLNENF